MLCSFFPKKRLRQLRSDNWSDQIIDSTVHNDSFFLFYRYSQKNERHGCRQFLIYCPRTRMATAGAPSSSRGYPRRLQTLCLPCGHPRPTRATARFSVLFRLPVCEASDSVGSDRGISPHRISPQSLIAAHHRPIPGTSSPGARVEYFAD